MAGLAEAWVAIKTLADSRTKNAVVVTSADDNACRAVGTFFEHEFYSSDGLSCSDLGVRCKAIARGLPRADRSIAQALGAVVTLKDVSIWPCVASRLLW